MSEAMFHRGPDGARVAAILRHCLEQGHLILMGAGSYGNIIRFIPPFKAEEVAHPHFHDVDLQMIYVLKGWYKTEFEGEGVHTFEAGSCWIQPPKIKHTVLGYSDDCELLEIVLPAEFETVMLEKLDFLSLPAWGEGRARQRRGWGTVFND